MANKNDKISFRPGDHRSFKINKFLEAFEKQYGEKLNRTDFMRMAIDELLDKSDDKILNDILQYENLLIKLTYGVNRNSYGSPEEYLDELKKKVDSIKHMIKNI